MPLPNSIGREIATVDRKDFPKLQALGENDERGVGEIHRVVGILDHQLEGPDQSLVVQKQDIETATGNKIHQPLRANAGGGQQMEGFGEHGERRAQGLFDARQYAGASLVIAIGRVEQGDERSSVRQDHRSCFWRIALETAVLAARAGATA